uniref:Uncharacterized protein n=1 Tax=Oryza meridionalis TaxID=40149 RepID=A0A0E0FDF9_9ORYZ
MRFYLVLFWLCPFYAETRGGHNWIVSSLCNLCGCLVEPSVLLRHSVQSGRCASDLNSASAFGVHVAFGGFCCGCYEGDSKVKTLLCLSVLATVLPLGTVHLLEGVAIGALIQLYVKGILRV